MKRILFIFLSGLFLVFTCHNCGNAAAEKRLIRKADRLHERILTLDSHCDTPLKILRKNFDIGKRNNARARGGKVDFVRMQEGGLDASFFAVFIAQNERSPKVTDSAYEHAQNMFASIDRAVQENAALAELAYTPEDAYRIKKTGRRAIFIGLENGYPIGRDLTRIREFYDLGARYITLCHTKNNDICDSSTDSTEHGGLSEFGREVVRVMNSMGMMIDLSHASDATFYDALAESQAPVILSHSCARALCNEPRNVTDDMLRALVQNDGVIQLCLYSGYIKTIAQNPRREAIMDSLDLAYPDYNKMTDDQKVRYLEERDKLDEHYPAILATVQDAVDHIDHIVAVAGIDHVGIGSDFDGGGGIEGCFDVSETKNITVELLRRGYNSKDIGKIWSGNFMRVFREVQKVADKP